MRAREAGGRAVERKLMLPVTPASTMIGISGIGRIGTGSTSRWNRRAGSSTVPLTLRSARRGGSRPTVLKGGARIDAARSEGLRRPKRTLGWRWRRGCLTRNGPRWCSMSPDPSTPDRSTGRLMFNASDLGGAPRSPIAGTGHSRRSSPSAAPVTPEPATERGFKIERRYFTLDGQHADATAARQNQRFWWSCGSLNPILNSAGSW